MMPDYRTGDVIRVANDAVEILRTKRDPELGFVIVGVKRMKDGSLREGSVFVDAPGTTVELVSRATPAEWPPRQKDLWRDRTGELWFTVDVAPFLPPAIRFVPSYDEAGHDPETVSRNWGPLTLVHREDGAA